MVHQAVASKAVSDYAPANGVATRFTELPLSTHLNPMRGSFDQSRSFPRRTDFVLRLFCKYGFVKL